MMHKGIYHTHGDFSKRLFKQISSKLILDFRQFSFSVFI